VLATAAVSMGGVAAVVRLAPDPGRLFGAHGGPSAPVRSAGHAGSAGRGGSAARAGSVGHAGTFGHARSVPRAGSNARGGSRRHPSGVGSPPGGTHTGGLGRHARLVLWHGHGLAVGSNRATHATHPEPAGVGHGHGGVGLHRGWAVAGHGVAAVSGVRHPRVEGHARGQAHSGAARGNGGHQGHRANPAASKSAPASPPAPAGKPHGRK
jgi:hypothetical protein